MKSKEEIYSLSGKKKKQRKWTFGSYILGQFLF